MVLDDRAPRTLYLDADSWSIRLDGTDPQTPRVIVLERAASAGSGTGKVLGVAHLSAQFPLLDGETD